MPKSKIPDLQASAMPPIKDYLTAVQRDGSEMCADDVYKQVSAIRTEIIMLVKGARPATTATMREVVYGG